MALERIDNILRVSRVSSGGSLTFKANLKVRWLKEAGIDDRMPMDDVKGFIEKFSKKYKIPVEAFDPLDKVFIFDFSGDKEFSYTEIYKFIKYKLRKYREALGGKPEIDVPEKSPDEAGYTIKKVLASGGQGSANLAENEDGDERVLKIYNKDHANAGGIDDLVEECANMKAAQHPCIAVCHEIFQDTGHLYMVSDPYMGGDFASIQDKAYEAGVDLNIDWYKDIFRQAFKGLDHLHRSCVVHCDIKEPNLMVRYPEYESPEVVIIDLGLSSAFEKAGAPKGTPGYMPPETWQHGDWFPTGDVFSMGVVVFQMLTRSIPQPENGIRGVFQQGNSLLEIAQYTANFEPRVEEMDPEDDELDTVISDCLDKDYEERPTPSMVLESPFFRECNRGGFSRLCSCAA